MTKVKITIKIDKSEKWRLFAYLKDNLEPIIHDCSGTMKIRGVKDDK